MTHVQTKLRASELKASEKTAARDLHVSEERAAAELKTLHMQHSVDVEYHEQVLSWMSGGYSVDSDAYAHIKKDSIVKHEHERSAVELKEAQRTAATALLESQQKIAANLQEKITTRS